MQTAWEGAQRVVHLEEAADFVHDIFEVAGLVAVLAGDGVAVHRVGNPQNLGAGGSYLLDQVRQLFADVLRAHAGDEGQAAWFAVWIELVDQRQDVFRIQVGPSFTPIGLRTRERKSTCAWSSWRVRSPIHRKWPEVSYGKPVRESVRVSARS